MIERLLIVLALLLLTVALVQVARALARRRTGALIGTPASDALRARLPASGPAVVYFYGPQCAPCVEQARELDELAREGGAVIVALDATQERDLADSLDVFMIPTTALVDAQGRVRRINLGYYPKRALALQLAAL